MSRLILTVHSDGKRMKTKYRLRAYGVTKEILGDRFFDYEMPEGKNVSELREELYTKFPRLKALRSLLIAVNNEYAEDSVVLRYNDDIALIPPVSGG